MTAVELVAAGAGLGGLAVGSWANVVSDRAPRPESPLALAARCRCCGADVRWRDRVPLVSWLVHRGRHSVCGCPVGVRAPLVEAGTAALFVAIALRFGLSAQLPAYLYLGAVGVVLALIDLDMRRLPDTIVLPSYVVSLLLLLPAGATSADGAVAGRAFAGLVALMTLFFALAVAYPNGLGFSEVRFAGLVGLYAGWLSWSALFVTAAGSVVIATAGGLAAVVTRHGTRYLAVPIAPCLTAAALLALFLTAPLVRWYGSLLAV